MDFEAIRDVWTAETGGEMTMADETMIRKIADQDRMMARRIRVRDYLELTVALGLAGGFLWVSSEVPTPWPWWLAAAITLAVGAVFVRERSRRGPATAGTSPLRDGLRGALADVDHQIRLLRSVAWWYLLPMAVVAVLIVVGTVLDVSRSLPPDQWERARGGLLAAVGVALAAVVPAYWVIWWANQRAVRQHLAPHRERIAATIRQLEANGESEAT